MENVCVENPKTLVWTYCVHHILSSKTDSLNKTRGLKLCVSTKTGTCIVFVQLIVFHL